MSDDMKPLRSPDVLVVVPCGRSKIWDEEPERGATRAANAYTGSLFKLNRAYAEQFGDAWVILSAKYGFIPPTFEIPGPYDVTFKRATTCPIRSDVMSRQVGLLGLDHFSRVVGLGGSEYRMAVADAFVGTGIPVIFPFAGLSIGRLLRATKNSLETLDPGF